MFIVVTMRNKLLLVVLSIGLGLVALSTILRSRNNDDIGDLSRKEQQINLGPIEQSSSKSKMIIISNKAEDDVDILDMMASCHCTSAKISQTVIASRSSAYLNVTMMGEFRVGGFASLINIDWKYVHNPHIYRLSFRCSADAVSLAVFNPLQLDFGEIRNCSDVTNTITIERGKMNEPWDAIQVSSAHTPLTLRQANSNKYYLTAALSKEQTRLMGEFRDEANLSFYYKGQKLKATSTIPISAEITSMCRVSPPCIYIGAIDHGAIKQGTLTISNTDFAQTPLGNPIKPEDAEISVELHRTATPEKLLLNYTFRPDRAKRGEFSGTILIPVENDKKHRLLIIRFMGIIT